MSTLNNIGIRFHLRSVGIVIQLVRAEPKIYSHLQYICSTGPRQFCLQNFIRRKDIKIVASTTSTLEEPSQKNTLKTNDPLIFAFEEPSKHSICLRNLRQQFSTLFWETSWWLPRWLVRFYLVGLN